MRTKFKTYCPDLKESMFHIFISTDAQKLVGDAGKYEI
jgi:hypothetical protein